jgi:hypothetical protein
MLARRLPQAKSPSKRINQANSLKNNQAVPPLLDRPRQSGRKASIFISLSAGAAWHGLC